MEFKLSKFIVIEIIFFILIIVFTIKPVENYDFWFHIKYGEYIFNTHSLPFTDVFSHTAYGQPAIPYEWLFQVILYSVFKSFGTVGVQILVAACMFVYLVIFRQILKEIFNQPFVAGIFFIGLLSLLSFDFWVERPQIVGYLIFMLVLYLILKRVFLGINWLWFSIPLFFIWVNLHASMILGLYLFFSFAFLALINYLRQRNPKDFALMRDMFVFGLVNSFITVLPPLGMSVYQLLILFVEKREFITKVLDEWVPLAKVTLHFYIYLVIIFIAFVSYIFMIFKNHRDKTLIFLLPLVPLGLFVISGIRQIPFATPLIFILALPFIQIIKFQTKPVLSFIISLFFILLFSLGIYSYKGSIENVGRFYPKQAIPFIKENLKGNMFNEYNIGGYLMYHLGPNHKTFIDGRTDMFLPVVLPEYYEVFNRKYVEDKDSMDYFQKLVDKYNISWAILSTNRYTPWRRLARILRSNQNWQIVFFDDTAEIYARINGVNSKTVKKFNISSATPFSKSLYKKNQREKARNEYENMQKMAPSAVSANALGFMFLEESKFDEAKKQFEEAFMINPYAPAPKMNLAELAAKDGNFSDAINLYRKAIEDDPERGLAYLRLGQLIVQSGGARKEAIVVWKKGFVSTPDEEIKRKLKNELSKQDEN